MAGQGLLFRLYWGGVSAHGHLLHGGYFLCQTWDHSKEPQVYESICHSEVHHLQDLKTKNKREEDQCQSVWFRLNKSISQQLLGGLIWNFLQTPEDKSYRFWWFHEVILSEMSPLGIRGLWWSSDFSSNVISRGQNVNFGLILSSCYWRGRKICFKQHEIIWATFCTI